jgi:hypothetical protein
LKNLPEKHKDKFSRRGVYMTIGIPVCPFSLTLEAPEVSLPQPLSLDSDDFIISFLLQEVPFKTWP